MTALVVYDSAYGNTARIADAIRSGLGEGATALVITDLDPARFAKVDLLVVGSPTQGGQPTAALRRWLESVPPAQLGGMSFAAFDTRLDAACQGLALRLLMRLIGYAAPRIAALLTKNGAIEATTPEGFIVRGREGPLEDGEQQRARAWGASLSNNVSAKAPSPAL